MFPDRMCGLLLINPVFEGHFIQTEKETPWTRYWHERYLPSLQLSHMLAAVGFTRLALRLGFYKVVFLFVSYISSKVLRAHVSRSHVWITTHQPGIRRTFYPDRKGDTMDSILA